MNGRKKEEKKNKLFQGELQLKKERQIELSVCIKVDKKGDFSHRYSTLELQINRIMEINNKKVFWTVATIDQVVAHFPVLDNLKDPTTSSQNAT